MAPNEFKSGSQQSKTVPNFVSGLLLPGYLDLNIWWKPSFIFYFTSLSVNSTISFHFTSLSVYFTLSQFHKSSLSLLQQMHFLVLHMSQQNSRDGHCTWIWMEILLHFSILMDVDFINYSMLNWIWTEFRFDNFVLNFFATFSSISELQISVLKRLFQLSFSKDCIVHCVCLKVEFWLLLVVQVCSLMHHVIKVTESGWLSFIQSLFLPYHGCMQWRSQPKNLGEGKKCWGGPKCLIWGE